ncbi:MAG TPA: hypothetical protein VGK56_11510 [Anaerolineales bacterium]
MNILLRITIISILLGSLVACVPDVSINGNPEDVSSAAAEIADFEPPAGYDSEFTASLLGYTVAAYNPGDGHSHLYLIQSDKESDAEKLEQMLAELVPGSSDPNTRLTVIENRVATVRGQEVTLIISDGISSDGDAYRQVTAAFQGKGGPALLVLSEPIERWDQSAVDTFIASIK